MRAGLPTETPAQHAFARQIVTLGKMYQDESLSDKR